MFCGTVVGKHRSGVTVTERPWWPLDDLLQSHSPRPSARAVDSLRHPERCHSLAHRGTRPAVRDSPSYRLQGAGVRGDAVLASWTGDSRASSLQQNQV